jgi:hypothetical protein
MLLSVVCGWTSGLAQPIAERPNANIEMKKEKPAGIAEDERVRKILSDQGDNGETPRSTSFYFYGGDLSGIKKIAQSHGFSIRRTVELSGVILEKTIAVDADHFEPVGAMMAAWAVKFRSDYDGWECDAVARR